MVVNAARLTPTFTVSMPAKPLNCSVSVVPMSMVTAATSRVNVTREPFRVMVMISFTVAPLNSIVSLPCSPLRMSLSSPGFQIITSSPMPPFIVSLAVATGRAMSLPSPPFSVSSNRPPRMRVVGVAAGQGIDAVAAVNPHPQQPAS